MRLRTLYAMILPPPGGSNGEPRPCCTGWSGFPSLVAPFLNSPISPTERASLRRTASSIASRARPFGSSRCGMELRSQRSRDSAANSPLKLPAACGVRRLSAER